MRMLPQGHAVKRLLLSDALKKDPYMRVPELPPSMTSTYSGPGLQSSTVHTAAVTCTGQIRVMLSLLRGARTQDARPANVSQRRAMAGDN